MHGLQPHPSFRHLCCVILACSSLPTVARASANLPQTQTAQVTAAKTSGPLGTISAISGNTITLATDSGASITISTGEETKVMRVAPGQKDLKDATTISLSDLQVGDRILARGKAGADSLAFVATTIIAIRKSDIAEKQTHEREQWQRMGAGGLVQNVDAAAGIITIKTASLGDKKTIVLHFSKDTIMRRYAADSERFDDAKVAPLEEIKPGDQLLARGTKGANDAEFAASEIVSGSFRNLAGTITSLDIAAKTITLQDLATKKSITVIVTAESQLRKLPQPVAARIAMRLKGGAPDAPGSSPAGSSGSAPSSPAGPGPEGRRPPRTANGPGGMGRGANGPPDLQQMISRMPAANLGDLQKGDAVMIVATQGSVSAQTTAITLLAGVEPILQSSSSEAASSILSPWSLSSAPGGDSGTP